MLDRTTPAGAMSTKETRSGMKRMLEDNVLGLDADRRSWECSKCRDLRLNLLCTSLDLEERKLLIY